MTKDRAYLVASFVVFVLAVTVFFGTRGSTTGGSLFLSGGLETVVITPVKDTYVHEGRATRNSLDPNGHPDFRITRQFVYAVR